MAAVKSDFVLRRVWDWLQQDKQVELVPWCKDPIKIAEMNSHKETMGVLERIITDACQEFDNANGRSEAGG